MVGHTRQMDKQDKTFILSILPMPSFNGHTGQMDKQHIYSKHSTPVFLKWTHRTKGQTTYSLKGFYLCLFRMDKGFCPCFFEMDTQDKRSNNIFIQSILPMSFFNGHTGQTDKQITYIKHFTPVFLKWTHRTNGQTTY